MHTGLWGIWIPLRALTFPRATPPTSDKACSLVGLFEVLRDWGFGETASLTGKSILYFRQTRTVSDLMRGQIFHAGVIIPDPQ